MRTLILLMTIILLQFSLNAQNNKTADKSFSGVRYDSIVKALHYKSGDRVIVYTQFRINKSAEVEDIQVRAPHKIFEEKAIYFLKNLSVSERKKLSEIRSGDPIELPLTIVIKPGSDSEDVRLREIP